MRFRRYNYVCGVASIFGDRGSFEEGVEKARRMAQLRARVTGMSESEALGRYFGERRQGQLSYLVFTMVTMGLTVWAARQPGSSEWVSGGLALLPAVAYLGATRMAGLLAPEFDG